MTRFYPRRRHHWFLLALGFLLLAAALSVLLGPRTAPLCAFHGWSAVRDLRRHHPLWGSYQLWRSAHACHS